MSKHSVVDTVPSIEAMQPRRTPRSNQLIHIRGDRFRCHPLVAVSHNHLDRGPLHRSAERQRIDLGGDCPAPADQPSHGPNASGHPPTRRRHALREAVDLEPRNLADDLLDHPVQVPLLILQLVVAVLPCHPRRAHCPDTIPLLVEAREPLRRHQDASGPLGGLEPVQDALRHHPVAVEDQPRLGGGGRVAHHANTRVPGDNERAVFGGH